MGSGNTGRQGPTLPGINPRDPGKLYLRLEDPAIRVIPPLTDGLIPLVGRVKLGAGDGNTYILDPDGKVDRRLSRKHCEIGSVDGDGRVMVVDLDSKNGTFVNGVRVKQAQLLPGSRLQLGETVFRVVAENKHAGGVDMLGQSANMDELRRQVGLVAPTPVAVLIQGETGTGKELVAREIHRRSGRPGEFITMNCASVPTGIAESELFGHVKGAFTGATTNRRGVFVEANGGTLFLDEIGELAVETQAKLLRALQEGSFRTIGAEGERKVDVRVVAATHRDLRATIKTGGAFREDLYYRLAEVPLRVPPLRERGDDILLLAEHFIQLVGGGYTLANATSRAMSRHKWRGNVRELKSAITRACIFTPKSELQPVDVLPDGASSAVSDATLCLQGKTLDDLHRDIFSYAMKEYGGTIRGAAAGLQMAKSTLFDEAKRLGIPFGRDQTPSATEDRDEAKKEGE